MSHLDKLGEFGLIDLLTRRLSRDDSVVLGIGDDCAVTRPPGKGLRNLFSCDAFIEEVHFRRAWASPEDIGWKATASALSDIAAMGGVARYMLVTLACPTDTETSYLEELYGGIRKASESEGVSVIGGDTTASPCGIILSMTVVGMSDGEPVYRSGACPGDLVTVTGHPGRAALGLHALEQGGADAPEALVQAQLRPRPKLAEGALLGAVGGVTAMIDISDGLVQDLGHIAERSGVSIDISPGKLPLTREQEDYAARTGFSASEAALSGGEDYELAFTVSPGRAMEVLRQFRERFVLPVTVIGEVRKGLPGVTLDGVPCRRGGFDHFHPAK